MTGVQTCALPIYKFFQYNGMESWNRSQRIVATTAAHEFIIRHVTKPTEHSARYLKELNLDPKDVIIKDGKLELNQPVRDALNQWVDEAILRPSAANRPIYMSDPNWMLVSHLKQYSYLFQKVIISRVYHELEHGNYTPAYALAGYVPTIMASDMLRVALTPGNNDDVARQSWTAADWLGHGVVRAGLLGPSQFALDTSVDLKQGKLGIESALGPTGEQMIDFVRASLQGHPGGELINAVPGLKYFRSR